MMNPAEWVDESIIEATPYPKTETVREYDPVQHKYIAKSRQIGKDDSFYSGDFGKGEEKYVPTIFGSGEDIVLAKPGGKYQDEYGEPVIRNKAIENYRKAAMDKIPTDKELDWHDELNKVKDFYIKNYLNGEDPYKNRYDEYYTEEIKKQYLQKIYSGMTNIEYFNMTDKERRALEKQAMDFSEKFRQKELANNNVKIKRVADFLEYVTKKKMEQKVKEVAFQKQKELIDYRESIRQEKPRRELYFYPSHYGKGLANKVAGIYNENNPVDMRTIRDYGLVKKQSKGSVSEEMESEINMPTDGTQKPAKTTLKPIPLNIVNQIKRTAKTRQEAEQMAINMGYDPNRTE